MDVLQMVLLAALCTLGHCSLDGMKGSDLELARHRYTQSPATDGPSSTAVAEFCFGSQQMRDLRDDIQYVLADKQVKLVFFYFALQVNRSFYHPGLCCSSDEIVGGHVTPLVWVWWRDRSGKAFLELSLQHVDMWMLPLFTLSHNIFYLSNHTLHPTVECWKQLSRQGKIQSIALLLQQVLGAGSNVCWREQTATFDPVYTLLLDALNLHGARVFYYHCQCKQGEVRLSASLTISYFSVGLKLVLFLLALYFPLLIMSAWQHAHNQYLVERVQFCHRQSDRQTHQSMTDLELCSSDGSQRGEAELAKLHTLLNPWILPSPCSLGVFEWCQSARVWHWTGLFALLSWQLFCVFWTSVLGGVDLCERCMPAAKHWLLALVVLLVGVYIQLRTLDPKKSVTHSDEKTDKRRESDELSPPSVDTVPSLPTPPVRPPPPLQYRLSLRTMSLRSSPFIDKQNKFGSVHDSATLLSALRDSLFLSSGIFSPVLEEQNGSKDSMSNSDEVQYGLLGCTMIKLFHVLTIIRISPLFQTVSFVLQQDPYLHSFFRTSNAFLRFVGKLITFVVFALMWCLAVWLLDDLFHIFVFLMVGMVTNAEFYVPWLVLLLTLLYQLSSARQELYKPFIEIKASILEEYVRLEGAQRVCTYTVEAAFTALCLKMVHLEAGSFQQCQWEMSALRSVQQYNSSPGRRLRVVFMARLQKIVTKWFLLVFLVQLVLVLVWSVHGFALLPAYLRLLASVTPLGLTWAARQPDNNLLTRLLQGSHARSLLTSGDLEACSCSNRHASPAMGLLNNDTAKS